MADTIIVQGSHGTISVDRSTGFILRADACDCADCARLGSYTEIAFFDPFRWDACALKHGQTDILCTAYVDKRGRYERECSVVTDGDDCYLDELLFLPAPQ
jgi:hypothetical protein